MSAMQDRYAARRPSMHKRLPPRINQFKLIYLLPGNTLDIGPNPSTANHLRFLNLPTTPTS